MTPKQNEAQLATLHDNFEFVKSRIGNDYGDMTRSFQRRLTGSGLVAELSADTWRPGSWTLTIDGTPQSHVDTEDPTQLHFDYIRRIGHAIDAAFAKGEPVTALHLGAGALTVPRYIDATRTGSRQQVIEIERELIDFVREHLPFPRGASIRCRYGDARAVMEALPSGLTGNIDLVVVDVFRGARTPAHVTSVEFYRIAQSLLSAQGVLVVNIADGPPLAFARSQLATLRHVFTHAAATGEHGVMKSKRFGNVVLVASDAPLPWVSKLAPLGPHPAHTVTGDESAAWSSAGNVVTDSTSVDSPPPGRNQFRT
jgi:spermidine synthase